MGYEVRWDWVTLAIYLLLTLFCGLLLKQALRCKKENAVVKLLRFNVNKKNIYYFIVLFILVFFMCTRVVKGDLGGADTLRYIYFFESFDYTNFVLKDILTMHGWEYLFFNLMYLVRSIGGNYITFSLIIYTVLIYCYLLYFDKNVDDENEWFISLIFILPYLKSMNIVRNCLAAAIGLISIESIKNNKKSLFFLFFILAYLNHYISIVILGFWLFCQLIPIKWYDTRKKTILISLGSFLVTVVSIPLIKQVLLLTRYAGYIDDIEFSPFGYMIYTVVYVLILLVYDDFIKVLKDRKHMIFHKMIVFLSVVVPAFTVVNGTQRLLLYFEIPRFIMYGDLYSVYINKIPLKYKKIFKYFVILVYFLWIIFRIWRMYEPSRIMPYKNIIFD